MEERPKRHSFGKGLLCGILLCVVAMGVGGCAAPYFYKMFTHTSLNKSLENEAEITEKMEELNDYINQYYLFDYTDENVESGIYKGMMAGLEIYIPAIIHQMSMPASWRAPMAITAVLVLC